MSSRDRQTKKRCRGCPTPSGCPDGFECIDGDVTGVCPPSDRECFAAYESAALYGEGLPAERLAALQHDFLEPERSPLRPFRESAR